MKRPVTRVADLLNPAAALLPAANVIMQLSLPGVGYGVLESSVDSGNVYKHPFKRARTTGTYLAVATMGTESDRELIRAAVDTAHRQVRSTASSPLSYNALDPALQLWVAACLYRYFVDQHEYLHGPLDAAAADAVYRDARRLGTTLQVRVPRHDAVGMVRIPATAIRLVARRPAVGRPTDSTSSVDHGLPALPVGHALSRPARLAGGVRPR